MPRRWFVKQFRYWWRAANQERTAQHYERSIRYRSTALLFAEHVADVS